MNRKNIEEIEISPIGLYIRSISDINPKWKDIRTSSDINELYEIARAVFRHSVCQRIRIRTSLLWK